MTPPGVISAVLFDVGGPLDTELIYERMIDEHIIEELGRAGISVSPRQFAEANERAVRTFAPNAYASIIWRLVDGDRGIAERVYGAVAARAVERHDARGGFELRPGIAELLGSLAARDLALGLAANQPADAIDRMGGLASRAGSRILASRGRTVFASRTSACSSTRVNRSPYRPMHV